MRGWVARADSVWRHLALRLLGLLIGVTLTGSFVQAAAAQEATDSSKIRVGVSSSIVYEDNVFSLSDSVATPPGAVRDDFRFTPSIDVDVVQPVGRQSVFLSGALGYDFYRSNKSLESERLNLEAGGNLKFGASCSSRLATSFGRQQSNLADFGRLTGGAGLPNIEKSVGFSARIGCGRGLGLQPSVTYNFEKISNNQQRLRFSDLSAQTIGASIGYARPSLGELSVFGSYRNGLYPNRPLSLGSSERDGVKVYSTGLRFSRDIGTQLKGTVSAGYTVVDPKAPGARRFKGATWSADLDWRPSDALQVGVGLSRDVQQSNLLDISYSINQTYSISAAYALSRQLQLTFSGNRDKRTLRASPLLPANARLTGDTTVGWGAGVRYQPQGRIGFSFDLRGIKRNSPLPQFDYDNRIATLTVRYGI
jgi:hypothetical protein